ncbi:IS3 family transposase [Mycoplasmatota bacterium]|nr:IS3 family transposase [Mycoplasmatota bacterium]QVK19194.1 IS3 family transposase [Mycoplasmatota bacterium]
MKKKLRIKDYIKKHRDELEKNPYVRKVGKTIQYAPEFKIKAVELKKKGVSIREIFESHGLPYKEPKSNTYITNWTKQYEEKGKESFFNESRGRNINGKSGRPKKEAITADEKVLIQEKIIEAQRQEIEALKKQLWQGRKVKIKENKYVPTQLVFQFIDDLKTKINVPIQTLCKYFNVSRSGYYKWIKSANKRRQRELQDKSDFKLISDLWVKNKEFGYQRITMHLRNDLGVVMNPKKVYRLMKKNGIRSTVRIKDPYKHLKDSYKNHHTFENVLDRNFDVDEPGTVFATDITYLIFNGYRYYLSVIKDLCTREIVAWKVSQNLSLDLSLDVINQLVERYGEENLKNTLIHSDQGLHYTNSMYVNKLKELNIIQSMSRKGNCLDNAKMETFFGHFKDECEYYDATDIKSLRFILNDYMNYYNHKRYQWTLKKMAPAQYRSHLLAA